MFIGRKLIYLELQRTGSSHVRMLLSKTKGCPGVTLGKHNSINDVPASKLGDWKRKLVVANMRNPWDWYVSLWAYGCMGRGALYNHLTFRPSLRKPLGRAYFNHPSLILKSTSEWKTLYSDVGNATNFKKWLAKLLLEHREYDLGEGFWQSPISKYAGLLTYRWSKLFCIGFIEKQKSLTNLSELELFQQCNSIVNFVIRNEDLEDGFRDLMTKLGV